MGRCSGGGRRGILPMGDPSGRRGLEGKRPSKGSAWGQSCTFSFSWGGWALGGASRPQLYTTCCPMSIRVVTVYSCNSRPTTHDPRPTTHRWLHKSADQPAVQCGQKRGGLRAAYHCCEELGGQLRRGRGGEEVWILCEPTSGRQGAGHMIESLTVYGSRMHPTTFSTSLHRPATDEVNLGHMWLAHICAYDSAVCADTCISLCTSGLTRLPT